MAYTKEGLNKEKPYSDLFKINVLLYKAIAFTSLTTRMEKSVHEYVPQRVFHKELLLSAKRF